MWNILLDELPEKWKSYPIDSDFRTGILISQCLSDRNLSDAERFLTAAGLLFPDEEKRPDTKETAEGLRWYLTEYHHDNNIGKKDSVPVMDFDVDQWRIYAAFLSQYHINLNEIQMHWFVFMGLLANLRECTFTEVMNIRQRQITPGMSTEEKTALVNAKHVFALKPAVEKTLNPEEQHCVEKFMGYLNIQQGYR